MKGILHTDKILIFGDPKYRNPMRTLFASLAIALVISCTEKSDNTSSTLSFSDTPEGAAVEARLKEYYKDMSARNWKKYRTHFWDNGTITTAWKQPNDSLAKVDVTSIDDFIKETPNGPDSQPIFEETMRSSKISVQGNIAEAWVEYDAKFGTKENLSKWRGTDVFTLLRHDGQWKIVSLVFEANQ
jgi:hypothetical protein